MGPSMRWPKRWSAHRWRCACCRTGPATASPATSEFRRRHSERCNFCGRGRPSRRPSTPVPLTGTSSATSWASDLMPPSRPGSISCPDAGWAATCGPSFTHSRTGNMNTVPWRRPGRFGHRMSCSWRWQTPSSTATASASRRAQASPMASWILSASVRFPHGAEPLSSRALWPEGQVVPKNIAASAENISRCRARRPVRFTPMARCTRPPPKSWFRSAPAV